MFYANFVKLCNSVKKSPSAVAEEIGVKRSTVTRWKQGKSLTDANLQKVADYFGVSTSELIGEEQKKSSPALEGAELDSEIIKLMLGVMTAEDLSALIADAAAELARRNAKQ